MHISFTANSKGREAGSQLIASELAFVLDVFDDCKGTFELHSSNSQFFDKIEDYFKE